MDMDSLKRPAGEDLAPEAKRRILFPLPNKKGLLSEPAFVDLGEESSLDLTPPPMPCEPQMLYPTTINDSPPSSQPVETAVPPRIVSYKHFPIIKNGLKYFKIGVDINTFTPFVALVSETTNKCIGLTITEFGDLVSEETFDMVVKNFESKKPKPVQLGDVLVNIKAYATTNNVCIEKKGIKVYFAMSSWKFIQRIKQLMKNYLSDCQTQSFYGTSNFIPLMTHAKNFCLPLAKDLAKMPESDLFTTLSHAMDVQSIFFPENMKQEMLAYHLEFLRETLLKMIQKA